MFALLLVAAVMVPTVPGALNVVVTPDTIDTTICIAGWSASVRPPVAYTDRLKRRLLVRQQLPGTVDDYQLDHLVSLSIGGSPRSTRNLWMQPLRQARADDRLEVALHKAVCTSTFRLRDAQRLEIAYKQVYG